MLVCVEFQVDCFVGIWGKFIQQKGILKLGDFEEVLNVVNKIGDDVLQKQGQGYVVFDSFMYGILVQWMKWFQCGFDIGKFFVCDMFSGVI